MALLIQRRTQVGKYPPNAAIACHSGCCSSSPSVGTGVAVHVTILPLQPLIMLPALDLIDVNYVAVIKPLQGAHYGPRRSVHPAHPFSNLKWLHKFLHCKKTILLHLSSLLIIRYPPVQVLQLRLAHCNPITLLSWSHLFPTVQEMLIIASKYSSSFLFFFVLFCSFVSSFFLLQNKKTQWNLFIFVSFFKMINRSFGVLVWILYGEGDVYEVIWLQSAVGGLL
jgi:hypothetical protein